MIRSSSEDNNDAYILVKGTITVTNTEAKCAAPNNRNKKVIFKNWASFTDCISQTGQIENDGTKDVQIMVSLKCLSNFWRTFEIPFINCEVNFFLTWSDRGITVIGNYGDRVSKCWITDAKIYVPVVTLSANDKTIAAIKNRF